MSVEHHVSIPQVLKHSGFLSSVEESAIPRIAATATLEHYGRGDLIFPEGAECRGIYVVARGAVKIYKIGPDGREHVLHVTEQGDLFGEAALFIGAGYPAYAAAVKDTTLVLLRKQPFLDLLRSDVDLCFKLLAAMSSWAHRLVTKLEFVTLRDAGSRLATYLITRADKQAELDLSIPKGTLASQLDIAGETLSRLLNRFEAEGIITVSGRHIEIHDRRSLEEIADLEQ